MLGLRVFAFAAAFLAVLAVAPAPARADPALIVGVSDDIFKSEPLLSGSVAHDLGLEAARVSLNWTYGDTWVRSTDVAAVEGAVSTGLRVVVSVYGIPAAAPIDDRSRGAYCGYLRDLVERVPQIRDIVIWNEPNLSLFWRPQFAADGSSLSPSAYEALLARCWDVLHAARPDVNVIAPALCPWGSDSPSGPLTISHSAVIFIRRLGEAYRASGRTRPIFDTVGHHVYGESPGERPWRKHPYSRRISQGDLDKLVRELQDAFAGTSQPVPGVPAGGRTASVWYMEAGFDTIPDPAKAGLYLGHETQAALPDSVGAAPWATLPDQATKAPDLATQLRDSLTLAYCQPYVGAYFNFLLRDQEDLEFWQSGLLWADRTPKASYAVFRDTVRATATHTVDCSAFSKAVPESVTAPATATTSGMAPLVAEPTTVPDPQRSGSTELGAGPAHSDAASARQRLTLRWVRGPRKVYRRHSVVRIAVRASATAPYVATLVDLRGRRHVITRGFVPSGRATRIQFRRGGLRDGRYRAVVLVPGHAAARLRSRAFVVRGSNSAGS